MDNHEHTKKAIIGLGLINVLIHIAFFNNLEYHRDELLYFALGLHPATGYASVPPMIGWLAALIQGISGFSLLSVKIVPAIFSGFFVLLCSGITKELGGKSYAQILTGIAIIFMPVTLRVFHLFQPVFLDLFFWSLLFFLVLKYVNTLKDKFLIFLGITFGIAMLNKYLVALMLPALLIPVIFTKHREVFSKKSFYTGMFLGLLIFLPNLLWQVSRGFPVVRHMKELSETQLTHVNSIEFLTDQILMTFAAFFLAIAGVFGLLRDKKYRFLFFSVLLVYSMLLLLRGKSYYSIGVIPLLIASGAGLTEKYITGLVPRIIIPLIIILVTLPIMPVGIPVFKQDKLVSYFIYLEKEYGTDAGRRFEDGSIHSLPQDYADQLGWEELTGITASAYTQIPDKSKTMIFCENYGQAGAIAVIGRKYGLPEPVSFNESFLYWAPKNISDLQHFIYINDELGDDVKNFFGKIDSVGSISNIHAREFGTTVYLCREPKPGFCELWKSALESEKTGKR